MSLLLLSFEIFNRWNMVYENL